MKIPTELKIGGHIYSIEVSPMWHQSNYGVTRPAYNLIWVDGALPKSQIESTLLHEVLEVINEQHALDLGEVKIRTLEQALYQVLSDNKMLR